MNAVQSYMRTVGAAYLARAVLETEAVDMNQAFTQYDRVVTVFQQEIDIALERCNTKLHVKLARFFEEVKAQLLHRAYNSPAIIEYKFAGPVHSLVAAYSIYDDATLFGDLERRNPYGWPWQIGPTVIAARDV